MQSIISSKSSINRAQKGAALVEFAILIPFLLLLLGGVAEIGYLYFHLNILNKSVQDGARYFSDPLRARKGVADAAIDISSGTNGTALTQTKNLIIYGNTTGSGSSLLPNSTNNYNTSTWPQITSPEANHIQVTAKYNHTYILGNLLRNLCGNCIPAANYPLYASSVFRVEGGS
ncbi:MAG: TadE/TadG family type IV pilus assembly protein [Methylomicrobium sp.]